MNRAYTNELVMLLNGLLIKSDNPEVVSIFSLYDLIGNKLSEGDLKFLSDLCNSIRPEIDRLREYKKNNLDKITLDWQESYEYIAIRDIKNIIDVLYCAVEILTNRQINIHRKSIIYRKEIQEFMNIPGFHGRNND